MDSIREPENLLQPDRGITPGDYSQTEYTQSVETAPPSNAPLPSRETPAISASKQVKQAITTLSKQDPDTLLQTLEQATTTIQSPENKTPSQDRLRAMVRVAAAVVIGLLAALSRGEGDQQPNPIDNTQPSTIPEKNIGQQPSSVTPISEVNPDPQTIPPVTTPINPIPTESPSSSLKESAPNLPKNLAPNPQSFQPNQSPANQNTGHESISKMPANPIR